ncbi:hypothetical protein JOL79_29060 [Microbispora sp. RL4-1S]|uniref:Uncharacterized protein n=1 Tax=Microbispora oryzae TaxID=2806554 RepID=A0A940WLS5_9ACTN|nr:hypothetical protein [Microbispora oryzae]MBP2707836.1 hypothetical protein [Microbispora oryzae]
MRHRLAALLLVATAVVAPAVTSAAPANASTLQMVYSNLPYDICISFGQSGYQNGRWNVWWCSTHQPQNGWNYTYDLWAYVN